jgi:NTE family protein
MTTDRRSEPSRPRIGLVLSGGGLRGAAHIGVLQQLVTHNIPIHAIVGSSAGAVVAAYYAAVGLSLEELEADARTFRGRHLLSHSLNVRLNGRFNRVLKPLSGMIPRRLEQLESASFDRLHHGIEAIGFVCHDVVARGPCYFSSAQDHDVRLSDVVRASASIPGLFPTIPVRCENRVLHLTDGGLSDCLPIAFAQRPPLSATHVIVSDCRWLGDWRQRYADNVIVVRAPRGSTGTLWTPSSTLLTTVKHGAAAVTEPILSRIRAWFGWSSEDGVVPEF